MRTVAEKGNQRIAEDTDNKDIEWITTRKVAKALRFKNESIHTSTSQSF